jgi:hypothetical protein
VSLVRSRRSTCFWPGLWPGLGPNEPTQPRSWAWLPRSWWPRNFVTERASDAFAGALASQQKVVTCHGESQERAFAGSGTRILKTPVGCPWQRLGAAALARSWTRLPLGELNQPSRPRVGCRQRVRYGRLPPTS